MSILIIIVSIWVLFVSYRIIKKERKRGIIVLSFIVVACFITIVAKKYGYREDIVAIVLAILFLTGMYFIDRQKK